MSLERTLSKGENYLMVEQYKEIQTVEVSSFFISLGGVERYTNIWPLAKKTLFIKRKSGVIRNFVISPESPDKFKLELEQRLNSPLT